MSYETELWPYIEAKHHGGKRPKPVRLIGIHTPIWPEVPSGAEGLGKYFATMADNRVASSHIGVDSDSVVQYVKDSFVAYAAPPCNEDGWHIEIIGTDIQSKSQWRDLFSITALALAADAAAQACLKFDLPPTHLTNDQLRLGMKGIVGHDQITAVYHKSDHVDPGPNFPWLRFMGYVKGAYEDRK